MNGVLGIKTGNPLRRISARFIGFIGLSIVTHSLIFLIKEPAGLQPQHTAIGNRILSISLADSNHVSDRTHTATSNHRELSHKNPAITQENHLKPVDSHPAGHQTILAIHDVPGHRADSASSTRVKNLPDKTTTPIQADEIPSTNNRSNEPDRSLGERQTAVLQNYLLGEIHHRLSQYLQYPDRARRRGWEGSVIVGFNIDQQGFLQNVHLARTSGYTLLDSAALTAIKKVNYIPVIHWGSRFQPVALRLPIVYRLTNS